jgi:hypothetical protein
VNAAFTARQIGDALGRPRQAIQKALASIPPTSRVVVNGNPASAWHFGLFSAALQSELIAVAKRRGYGEGFEAVAAMFAAPPAPWQPRVLLAQRPQADVDRAVKLRSVLEPFLRGRKLEVRSQAEFEAAGVAAWKKEFGHAITGRWFRALFSRTLERDNGMEDFTRLELYLDETAAAPPPPARSDRLFHSRHEASLGDTIRTLENPAKPTADDKQFLFDAAFRHLETTAADMTADARSEFKRTLIDFLYAAVPSLAANHPAFRWTFNHKLKTWTAAGGLVDALQDRRSIKSGNHRKQDFTADFEKIRNEAILHGGNESLAYRKLRQAGQLSPAFVNHYHFDERQNKSYLPRPVREAITNEVEMCGPLHRGPWLAKMRGPYIPRDWSGVSPADWFSGDDVTWNNYFYFYDDEGRLHIERGECLLLHDFRTGYILDSVLIGGKYNSRHIRKLILAVHDRHGLPHQGFYFERGVWKARIITDIAANDSLHWRETESGLEEYGLHVRHARTPRAKTIEGLFRILQERQRSEPGFVGFNERIEDIERMQDFLARCRAGKANPAEKLLSMDQWAARLDQIFAEFNSDPQNGKMLHGQSPAEAWQAGLDKHPLRKLPDTARYLLATHCKKVHVRQEGIVLNIGKNRMLFCNDHTGPLIGRDVLAYFNLEAPDLLTVSDLNRQNYFTVKAISLPALSATKEQFAAAHSQIAGHTKPAREIYGSIRHPRIATITRDNIAAPETAELGRFHNEATEQFKQEQMATMRTLRKIQLAAPGRPLPENIRNPDRVLQGIEIEEQARARIAAKQEAGAVADEVPAPSFEGGNGDKKTYVIKSNSAAAPSVGQYWALWGQVEKVRPGLSRHALTEKALGCHPKPHNMTPAQLVKMTDVFTAIIRDSKQAAIKEKQ